MINFYFSFNTCAKFIFYLYQLKTSPDAFLAGVTSNNHILSHEIISNKIIVPESVEAIIKRKIELYHDFPVSSKNIVIQTLEQFLDFLLMKDDFDEESSF